jgi:hypothetical protein
VEIAEQEDDSVSAGKWRFPCKKMAMSRQGSGDFRARGWQCLSMEVKISVQEDDIVSGTWRSLCKWVVLYQWGIEDGRARGWHFINRELEMAS